MIYVFYFLSGATALLYEVVWARRLGLIFGVDAYGVSTVLAVFFLGLAIGALIAGRLVDRSTHSTAFRVDAERPSNVSKNSLFLYGLCEVGIGLYAAATPYIFLILEKLQILFNQAFTPSFGSFNLFTFLLSMSALAIPTTLIGATFPIVAKAIEADTNGGENVGLLYGINTLGASTGTILTGFFLIYFLGMRGTIWVAVLLNVLIGIAAIQFSKRLRYSSRQGIIRSPKFIFPHYSVAIKLIVFLTGFAALALEILWTRVLILTFGPSTYSFTLVLANFLLGIGFGSLIGRLILKRVDRERLGTIFAISLVALGIFVVLSIPLFGNLPLGLIKLLNPTALTYVQVISSSFLLSFLILIVPTSLMGMSFVWILHLTGDAGQTYFLNTIGGVVGGVVAGFFLLPLFGIQKSILVSTFPYFLCSFLASLILYPSYSGLDIRLSSVEAKPRSGKKRTCGERSRTIRWVYTDLVLSLSKDPNSSERSIVEKRRTISLGLALLSFITISIGFMLPAWDKNVLSSGVAVYFQDYFQDRESLQNRFSRGDVLYYNEGLTATVMVKRAPEGFLFLRNNGKTDASTDQDLDDLHLIGHLPLILHQDPQEVLIIGMGSGITAGSVASHPVKSIDVVEIEPAVFAAAGYFGSFNNEILSDERLHRIRADARFYLRATIKKYDVITSQPSNLWVRGNASLFTKDFFEMSNKRLKDDGLILQWIPFYSFSDSELKTALKTFTSVFPYVTVWTPVVSHDILLIGSKIPQKFDFEKISSSLKLPKVQKDLETTQITSSERLVAHYLFDEDGLKDLVDTTTALQTDDKPILEFSSAFSLYKNTEKENLSQLLTVSGDYSDHFTNRERLNLTEVDATKESIRLILGAKIKTSQNQLVEAADDFEKALTIIPKTATKKELARVYFELAKKAYSSQNEGQAISYFDKSVAHHQNAQVYLNLSILYLEQNRVKKAEVALLEAKKLDPTNPRLSEVAEAIQKAEQK